MGDDNIWTDEWDEGEDWSGGGAPAKWLLCADPRRENNYEQPVFDRSLGMLPDRASFNDEHARDLSVREAVCHSKHHLALPWRQLGRRLRIECCEPATVSGRTVERCEMWAQDLHDHPLATTEISAAIDADLRSPPSRRIEVDVDLIDCTGIAKVRVEIRALRQAAA